MSFRKTKSIVNLLPRLTRQFAPFDLPVFLEMIESGIGLGPAGTGKRFLVKRESVFSESMQLIM
jgi:hypothetical protein